MIPEEYQKVHGRDLHPWMIRQAEAGEFTALHLFDNLPWLKGGADWTAWRAFLCALYGLPMTEQEYAIYQKCTGRTDRPTEPADEAWLPVGRRGRKSAVVSVVVLFNAAYRRDYKPFIAPGETPTVPILAKDKYEAKQIRSYLVAMLSDERLSYLLDGEPTTEEVKLKVPGPNGDYPVSIIIRAATITAGRSRAVLTAVLDEVAFFRSDESANPDKDILRGLQPGMANIPGAMTIGLSSPYARKGLLWDKYRAHYGKPGRILIWKADTETMHSTPAIRETVRKAYAEDPTSAKAEYGAEFRQDVAAFVLPEVIDACVVTGRHELPPRAGIRYHAFVDASGGAVDSFTLTIAHLEPWSRASGTPQPPKIVVDLLREVEAPFDPKVVVKSWVSLLKGKPEQGGYAVGFVKGDYYAGEWVGAEFRQYQIGFLPSERSKSEIFSECLPRLNSHQVELLDIQRLKKQFLDLERKASAGGKETINHPPGGHDDVANAVAGAIVEAAQLLQAQPEHPAKTYLKADGTLDYEALNRERLKRAAEERRAPSDGDAVSERYRLAGG